MMAWLGTLWWCLLETCSGLCDKLRFGSACNPLPLPGPVPDDLLMEIFSRMPAECVHQCKQVYEDWDTLFSTLYFNYDIFLPRASPTIIVHRWSSHENQLFYIDDDHRGGLKCTQISQTIKINRRTYDYCPQINNFRPIRFSCYGLLFLDTEDMYENISRVVNPITRKWITLPSVSNVKGVLGDEGVICGAYFHPTAREFHLLWVSSWKISNGNKPVEFKLLRLPSEKNPKICWNALSKFESRPMTDEPPVNLHDCLHWTCCKYKSGHWFHLIMVFSIIKEEFTLMPSIPTAKPLQDKHKSMHLLDLDGYLSLWELSDVLNIWTVEEYYASWSWTKRYNIEINSLHKGVNIDEVSVVGCQNGALVIHWKWKGIFIYHLQHKSTKKYLFGKFKQSYYVGRESIFEDFTTAFLHTKSLISLNGFRSMLVIPGWV